jgi:hypothetical protein
MRRDKVEHYYLLTTALLMSGRSSSSLNIWMPHGIHTKRTPVAAEHTALRYQNDKLMQYQIGKMTSVLQRDLFCACVWLLAFFFPFITPSCASPKALHDKPYQLETLRDWIFVNKKYCTKGPAWSAIPIRNTKRMNFCEQNLQETG